MSEKIAVLGAGSWGSILASVLDENGMTSAYGRTIPSKLRN